ncbi:MAG TPA: prenyltransferase/squalene oxidase repeat-containing protein [Solirubrobacteraceae bacterium]|jgi:energy-coupling factor transport system substrate-specific component|nr:prenyltransferase/squalene oxidase repeat-containing protein [Solirubrobacteraceae bacterium]
MSWPLASFAIVAGILLAGWLAYERSRPSARMVAVVATLAAVAALGRDAFVALPDVKPITAIALVVGYALGPLPGFTVGAIGMLASNMMLGQGPYTPWQMAAWGLVGLAGALLGRVSGRRMGRFGLALSCAVMALVAKEIMNVYTWTLGAAHTPAAFLLIAGQGLPFDITDTVASFLFGFAFGPELARLLGRMRVRMTVQWEPTHPAVAKSPPALLVLVCVVGLIGVSTTAVPPRARAAVPFWAAGARLSTPAPSTPIPASAAPSTHVRAGAATSTAISRGVAYLARAQNADGGFGGAPGQHSSELYSAWVAIGLAAAGRDPLTLTRDGHSLLSSLRGEAATLEDAGDDERTILALHASGLSPSDFPGTSLLAKLVHERSSDGSFGHLVNITAFAVFALRVAGSSADNAIVGDAGSWIAAQQDSDGGFGFAGRGGGEDVDDTAAALQAVIDASGRRGGAVVARAVAYLRRAQNPDGGFPQQPGGESNAQSSAWAVQGLDAAGVNMSAVKRAHSRSPLAYLESLMAPNGSVYYSRTSAQSPVWVTAEALTALAGKPFPIGPDFSGS